MSLLACAIFCSAGESFTSAGEDGFWARAATAATIHSSIAIRFIAPLFRKGSWPPSAGGHERWLKDWADSAGLASASSLARTNVVAVTTAMRGLYIGERGTIARFIHVDAIANTSAELHRVGEDASDGARSNVDNVIVQATPIGKSSQVTSEKTKAFLFGDRSWRNSGVQPHQIGDRSGISTGASR